MVVLALPGRRVVFAGALRSGLYPFAPGFAAGAAGRVAAGAAGSGALWFALLSGGAGAGVALGLYLRGAAAGVGSAGRCGR